jgi:hypothetical protein
MATSLFNCRMEDDLIDAVDAAAEQEGLKKSTWAREVLGACAIGGVTLADLNALIKAKGLLAQSPHPERHLALQGMTGRTAEEQKTRGCLHPVPGRKQLAFSVICGVCGATVKKT